MILFIGAVVILIGLAISDLIVGVSNDAVNFLNSSLGSKVAPRRTIMIIASLGILAGVTFSSGMMEVARKGIFHPKQFLMPELLIIFLAVMLTDILLLDLYNTFGLPTSTTVSIVFELLGAAVAVSIIKIGRSGQTENMGDYINTERALLIISGILLSVAIAFLLGAIVQYITRYIFTFDYRSKIKHFGSVWGGIALSAIIYFILIKGAKGASFMSDEMLAWIQNHADLILLCAFIFFTLFLQALISLFKINVLKVIILAGTFAIAMAFAANDLVNFIGVPLAGLNAYNVAQASGDPLTVTMDALQRPIQSNTLILLIAGAVMVSTLWISRKARTVTKTELSLGRQDEGVERFGSSPLARVLVRMFSSIGKLYQWLIPGSVRAKINKRWDQKKYNPVLSGDGETPSWDLLRASVNLVVASAIISFATSLKLPLSTTYVTFMVAMGTSLSDRAWGSESAVYRVTGVLTVIGGWFFTAFMAFSVAGIFAVAIFFWRAPGVIGILLLTILLILRNHRVHNQRENEDQTTEIFNLKKVSDASFAIDASFKHSGHFLMEVKETLTACFSALFSQDRFQLKKTKKKTRIIQKWANIITANIFKTLRLLTLRDVKHTQRYFQVIGALQEIAESLRDAVMRAYTHINNNHKGLLKVQIEELEQVKTCVNSLLEQTSQMLLKMEKLDTLTIDDRFRKMKNHIDEFDKNQIKRIQNETSKTRLSILFYGLNGDCIKIAEQTVNLVHIFRESFVLNSR